MNRRSLVVILIGFFLCVASAATPVDLRILIDTSGSMKHTDPLNLRVPAVRLLVGLLPQGARAGVFAFDQKVVSLVPPGEVNSTWQNKAKLGVGKIHSRGMFTDISAALEESLVGWDSPDGETRRAILLLTDGKVDVSKDPAVNATAREQLLSQTLPKVHGVGASIYSIALSDDVDHDLLRQLSRDTNGWYEQASDAGLLQRLFLRMFDRTVRRDALPLKDNRFIVDASVRELTLVVFRKTNSGSSKIVSPDGSTYSRESPPNQGHWAAEQGYDMVTVEKPLAGSWQIQADSDPDNRAMVITDLNLEVDPFPAQALLGEPLDLVARLREKGKVVTDSDFLKLLNFTVTRTADGEERDTRPLQDNGVAPDLSSGDGIFSMSLSGLVRPGPQELQVTVEGPTFQRELHYALHLYPAGIETRLEMSDGMRMVVAKPVADLLDLSSLSVTASITDPGGIAQPLNLVHGQDGTWSALIPGSSPAGNYVVVFQARGRTLQGRALSFVPPPLTFTISPVARSPVVPPVAPPAPILQQVPPTAPPQSSSLPSWLLPTVAIIAANAFLVGLVIFGLRWWRKRNESMLLELEEQIGPSSETV